MPFECAERLAVLVGIELTAQETAFFSDWWNNQSAGKKGMLAQRDKYGPLGTTEGRIRGGTHSYLKRKGISGDIFTPKSIRTPIKSIELAECLGLLIGDGCITGYQVSVSLSSLVDTEYARFVENFFIRLFGICPRVSIRDNANCITVTTSSVRLVEFLKSLGLPQGHKIRHNLKIPDWVLEDSAYSAACVRGIFDTDGCIFMEKHHINGRSYAYPRMSFVSASNYLRTDIYNVLKGLGFEPRIRNNRSVTLEKLADIAGYFKIVGSSNPKHLERFYSNGRVA